jgi:serine/threonine-protein kinase
LGAGGMGCVVLAHNVELEQRVAVKMLLPGLSRDGDLVVRLLREARAAASLQSDHVVKVFDVTASGDFAPYIVMEYLEGESLGARLRRVGRLDLEEAVGLLIQACEAVAEAHALGIVHRDLKPENLFITKKPGRANFVKVLDFGISKRESSDAPQITRNLALLGSPAYASPEQLRASRDAGPAADIWALGIILYECVTGTRPFEGATLPELCTQILHEAAPRPRSRHAELPERLEKIILKCLDKEPSKRFASAAELVRELAQFAPLPAEEFFAHHDALTHSETSAPYEQRSGLSTATALSADMRSRSQTVPQRRRPELLFVLGVAALLVVAFAYRRFRTLPEHSGHPAVVVNLGAPSVSALSVDGARERPPLAASARGAAPSLAAPVLPEPRPSTPVLTPHRPRAAHNKSRTASSPELAAEPAPATAPAWVESR